MIINKKVLIPAKEIETYEFTQCDICKVKYDVPNGNYEGYPELCRTVLKIEEGGKEYNDVYYTEKSLDICPSCFKSKVIPLLEDTFGVQFNTREIDY